MTVFNLSNRIAFTCFSLSVGALAELINSWYQSLGRCAVIIVLTAKGIHQDFFLNMNPVEESATYWDKDYEHAEIVRESQSEAKE